MEIIAWEKLSDYIGKRLPAVLPVAGKHRLALVVGKDAGSLGLRIPVSASVIAPVSPYREVAYAIAFVERTRVLELTTSSPELFHGFYLFAALVIEHIEERGDEVLNAIKRAQHVLGQLLIKRPLLSEERQLGLIGELALLEAVLRGWGTSGFSAWVGPLGERHDFRFGDVEVEVKSTASSARKHRINGVGQLEASPGRSLYILSLQFEAAGMGAGRTLTDRVGAVEKLLRGDVELVARFDRYLSTVGYRSADSALYVEPYEFRSRPELVPVDANCPKIATEELMRAVPKNTVGRIGEVTYEVDLSGLGHNEDTEAYRRIFGKATKLR